MKQLNIDDMIQNNGRLHARAATVNTIKNDGDYMHELQQKQLNIDDAIQNDGRVHTRDTTVDGIQNDGILHARAATVEQHNINGKCNE